MRGRALGSVALCMDWLFRENFRRCEAPIPLLAVLDLLECGREPTHSGEERFLLTVRLKRIFRDNFWPEGEHDCSVNR
jgi:hypothetical protein